MSWAEDFGIDIYDEDSYDLESCHYDGYKETWKCKDGRVLKIQDMDSTHLRNTIQMLIRKGNDVPIAMGRELWNRRKR